MSKQTRCRKERACDFCGEKIVKGEVYIKVEIYKAFIPKLGRPIYDTKGFHPKCFSGNLENLAGVLSCDGCGEGFITGTFVVKDWKPYHEECSDGTVKSREKRKEEEPNKDIVEI